ncbi:MAG: TRAP transporter large permease subunit [Burkholderiales bacterium]
MSAAPGIAMFATVAMLLLVTGLPSWLVLVAVTLMFGAGGVVLGAVSPSLLTAMPARVQGLLESDILQALPLYVLLGAMLNHLPLAGIVFRASSRALRGTGAGPSLAALGLAALLAPMNGSVGASALMLGRAVQPRLDATGLPRERGAALVCVASTLGVVVPPSLVLILLGDAMMRAHTEALNVTHAATRILNTQDIFVGALPPALVLFVLVAAIAWFRGRGPRAQAAHSAPVRTGEWMLAVGTLLFIVALLAGVTFGYLFAVEAAAAGGVALFAFGLASRTLSREVLRAVLRDTIAITGALFALLLAATMFTLVLRAYGTDRWLADMLAALPGGATATLAVVLALIAGCGLVLDAFEMIFVVIPVVMPPLLAIVPEPTWIAVLALLILQASFLLPPLGYAILLTRQMQAQRPPLRPLMRSLAPYLAAQWLVFALVLAVPALVWQRNPLALPTAVQGTDSPEAGRDALMDQLNRDEPANDEAKP